MISPYLPVSSASELSHGSLLSQHDPVVHHRSVRVVLIKIKSVEIWDAFRSIKESEDGLNGLGFFVLESHSAASNKQTAKGGESSVKGQKLTTEERTTRVGCRCQAYQ